jgi:hypothetical protein
VRGCNTATEYPLAGKAAESQSPGSGDSDAENKISSREFGQNSSPTGNLCALSSSSIKYYPPRIKTALISPVMIEQVSWFGETSDPRSHANEQEKIFLVILRYISWIVSSGN